MYKLFQFGLVVCILLITACGDRTGTYQMGTSTQEQAYRDLGKALQAELKRRGRMQLTTIETNGSLDNLERLHSGELDFALVQGGFEFDDTGLQMVAAVDIEYLHIVVPSSSGIHDLADLAGKRVAAGIEGTGSGKLAKLIVDAASFDPPVELVPTTRESVADQLSGGAVDAAMFVADMRRELKPVLASGEFRLVGVKASEALAQLLFDVDVAEIPAGIYGMNLSVPPGPLPTLSVQTNLVVREDVPDIVIEQLIKALYDFRVRRDAWLPELTEEIGGHEVDLPLHQAAVAYYSRNDPLTSAEFEIAAFILAAIIALVSVIRVLWRWYRNHVHARRRGVSQ